MAIPDDKVRIQVIVDKKIAKKIARFAERFQCSQSRMAATILEAGTESHEWLINMVSSKFAERLFKAFGMEKVGPDPGDANKFEAIEPGE